MTGGSAGPPQASSPPSGGGTGAARPWGPHVALFLPCAAGTEELLADEVLRILGPQASGEMLRGGVTVDGDATTAMRLNLESRLAQRKIHLDLDEDALKWLADEGYDPVFGARPLKRVIQRSLQNPLAEMLLSGEVLDGQTVHVTAGPDGLIVGNRVTTAHLGDKGDGAPRAPLH